MNKSFYFFANFFLSLSLASGIWESFIRFQVGVRIVTLEWFPSWFLLVNIIALIAALFLLKYYHDQKYRFTFVAATIATLANLYQSAILCVVLLTRQLESYYIPAIMLSLGASILYALSLIFSGAGKRPWLKAAGMSGCITGLLFLSVLIWSMNSQQLQTNNTTEKITQWIVLISSLIPLLFIMHFSAERKLLKADTAYATPQKSAETFVSLVGIVAFLCTFVFGVMLANESFSMLYWEKRNFEKTQKLAHLFEARTYISSTGDTLPYRLLKPLNYDPQKKYPLVVCLPYGGQPGTDPIRQIEGAAAAQLLSEEENRKKYPAFLFVPHCPPGSGWGGIPNYPAIDALVYECLTALEAEPGIDVKRRYVTGISRGGYGSWHFICSRPEMFAAAIPVCGAGDPGLAPKVVDVAVWAFHGEKDKNVPVQGSRNMIEAIKKAGGHPRYTEFPGAGHSIWYQVTQTPGLLDWLFAQKQD